MRSSGALAAIGALLIAAAIFALPPRASAAPPPPPPPPAIYTVLYNFTYCGDPSCIDVPSSGVTINPTDGSLFGTACANGTAGAGGVYMLSEASDVWSETVLGDFSEPDPSCPTTANLLRAGPKTYYGTTFGDGDTACGTVFELSNPSGSQWKLTILHSFQNKADGCGPHGGLIMDAIGNLYGTTYGNNGTVFELVHRHSGFALTTLYRFDGDDGSGPTGALIMDKGGNLYGTTYFGGSEGCGTVFKLSTNGRATVQHNFCTLPDDADGLHPTGGLVMDKAGNLYGVTYGNGTNPAGTVYKLSRNKTFMTLYTFCSLTDCADGANPYESSLILDTAGNLYGTTQNGGTTNSGVVFEITNGEEIVLHSLNGTSDGAYPAAPLAMDKAGNIYGTTSAGGGGMVFELTR